MTRRNATSTVANSLKIQPEYSRAISKYTDILREPSSTTLACNEYVIKNGSICKLDHPCDIKAIPSGENWRWNQSKSKVKVNVAGADIIIQKLIPRKKKGCIADSTPSYKLWIYTITHDMDTIYGSWCEKGVVSCTDPQTTEDFSMLSIEDFVFLSPFVDPSIVPVLWPSVSPRAPNKV